MIINNAQWRFRMMFDDPFASINCDARLCMPNLVAEPMSTVERVPSLLFRREKKSRRWKYKTKMQIGFDCVLLLFWLVTVYQAHPFARWTFCSNEKQQKHNSLLVWCIQFSSVNDNYGTNLFFSCSFEQILRFVFQNLVDYLCHTTIFIAKFLFVKKKQIFHTITGSKLLLSFSFDSRFFQNITSDLCI